MIKWKKMAALLATGVLVMGMALNVSAEENKEEIKAEPVIKKQLVMPEGVTVPEVTFEYKVEATGAQKDDAATINDITINFTKQDQANKNTAGQLVVNKEADIEFATEFKHAGYYTYEVSEVNDKKENFTYDQEKYTLNVMVENTNEGPKATSYTASNSAGEKVTSLDFINKYEQGNAKLTITKSTEGNYADRTKKFDFTIEFIPSSVAEVITPDYKGTITGGSETREFDYVTSKDFQLADGETLTFNNLPVGTRYVVTEKGVKDGYIATKVATLENGQNGYTNGATEDEEGLASAADNQNNLVGENANSVEYTNTYNDSPLTGVVLNNMPFILMAAVAVAGLVLLMVLKKKRA